ncbi:MAG: N-acetyltransferase, partial [Phycisphaerae bacterium]|nr:N-acetyltransferase [Phycisphaerae bacterium]
QLSDVPAIRDLINMHAEEGRMLFRSMADLYESIRDFKVYEGDGKVLGCCALPIIWADLAEVKSLAVLKGYQGKGIGAALVKVVVQEARQLKLPKIFTLTLEEGFFLKLGFQKVTMDSLPMKVWSECIHCSKQDQCDEIALIYTFD